MSHAAFVFTSNADGHFQKAGFTEERIAECHGSIYRLQCIEECSQDLWPADDVLQVLDEHSFRLVSAIPRCQGAEL